jgi:hypothetical protein
MKKLINISLILMFTLTFACQKERILPVGSEDQNEQCNVICGFEDYEGVEDGDGTKSSSGNGDVSTDIDNVTDPDEDEDFEGEDQVTDPDEDEDFESEELGEVLD